MTATVTGADAVLPAGNYYLKLSLTPYEHHTSNSSVTMTSSDGETYGVSDNKLFKGDKTLTTNTNYFVISATWSESASADDPLEAEDRVTIAADTTTGVEFKVSHKDTSTGRVRLGVKNSAAAVTDTTLRKDAYVKVFWAAGTSSADPVLSFQIKEDGGTYQTYAVDGYRLWYSVSGQLAVEGDSAKSGGDGLSIGDDLPSSFIDAHYAGKSANAENDGDLGNKLKLEMGAPS